MSQAVNRIARILRAFSTEAPSLALTECARRAELTKSTAQRLLQSLADEGLVERVGDEWRLGPAIITLATVRVGSTDLRREALPQLRSLRSTFQTAVALAVPDGHHILHIEQPDSPDVVGVRAKLGSRVPMWATASGKVILAFLQEDDREDRLDTEEWHRVPSKTRERVQQEIAAAATIGYCVDRGEFFDGVGGVAAAVRNMNGDPIAAICVIESGDRLTNAYVHRIAGRLLEAVGGLEVSMGYRPGLGTESRTDGHHSEPHHPTASTA